MCKVQGYVLCEMVYEVKPLKLKDLDARKLSNPRDWR